MEKPWLAHYEAGIPHSLTYPPIPLHSLLDETAQKFPECTAVNLILKYLAGGRVTIGGKLTYRQLKDAADRFASALSSLGVRKGDRVAVMVPNLPQFVIAFFGAMRLGAIVVNVNPTYTAPELKHQLQDSGAETIVLLNLFYPKLKQIQPETSVKRVIVTHVQDYVPFPFNVLVKRTQQKEGHYVEVRGGNGVYWMTALMEQNPPTPPRVEVKPEDVALFQYTGGTTGVPKAAMLSHHNLVANTLQVQSWMPSAELGKEKALAAIPFFHAYGLTVAMLYSIRIAAEIIVVPNPRPIEHVMNIIQKERATVFPGVPAMYIGIVNHPRIKEYDLRSIKACISGAAPLPMEVQEKFGELTGGRLVEGFGMTEASPVTHCNPVFGLRKKGSIGIPLPDVEARIVDLDTGDEQPIGKEGELVVRGPQVMLGYWNRPDETAKTKTSDGWLLTGDIARMDEDGYFYIVDRKKDLIIASGYNVIPREVEEVLYTYPKVQEAVVAGVPHPYRGETVKAYIVLKPGESATAEEIINFCKENLAPYKVPTLVEFRPELPKTMVGKFLRRVLVEEEKQKFAAQKAQEKP